MKIGLATILFLIGAALVYFGYWQQGGIAVLAILTLVVLGVLAIFNIVHIGKAPEGGTKVLNALITIVTIIMVANAGGYLGQSNAKALDTSGANAVNEKHISSPAAGGEEMQAIFNFYPGSFDNSPSGFGGGGIVYLMDSGIVGDRNDFMKVFADGKQNTLTLNGQTARPLTFSSGDFTYQQLTGKKDKSYTLCGYQDTTPAAGENVSWCKTIKLTGITGGSTPAWMYSGGDFVWREYASAKFYDDSDTYRTVKLENQATAIEKHLQTYVFPANNGEQITDAYLYLEMPSANAGAISEVKITNMQTKEDADYTTITPISQLSTSDPAFLAAPTLTTGSNTMYVVGKFPGNTIRTSTSDLGKFFIDVRYTHPATETSVLAYFKGVQNFGAKTLANGHFDFADKLTLNMSTSGTTGWT